MLKENLKKLRQMNKLSQQIVADNIGVNRATYTRYENGERKPDPEMLKKIATYFNTSLEYLLDFKSSKRKIESNNIAEIFIALKYPPEARKEIEQFLEYIDHKYNLK